MKYSILVVFIAGVVLGAASFSSDADRHKGVGSQDQAQVQQQNKDRLHEKERVQKGEEIKLKDEKIYGYKLMSPEELNQYRQRLRLIKTEEDRARFEAQHRDEMQKRAQVLDVKIEDAD